MKAKVTILHSSSSNDEDDTNSLAFMALRTVKDLPTTSSKG